MHYVRSEHPKGRGQTPPEKMAVEVPWVASEDHKKARKVPNHEARKDVQTQSPFGAW
jgi:hypothetical protein